MDLPALPGGSSPDRAATLKTSVLRLGSMLVSAGSRTAMADASAADGFHVAAAAVEEDVSVLIDLPSYP